MRKLLAMFVIAAMLVVQLAVGTVFATELDQPDIRNVINELEELDSDQKDALLASMWEIAVTELNDDDEVDSEVLIDAIRTELGGLWEVIVSEDGGDGTISEASVEKLVDELINHKSIVISLHDTFESVIDGLPMVEEIINPDGDDLGVAFVNLMNDTGPVLKDGVGVPFAPNDGMASRLLDNLDLSGLEGVIDGVIQDSTDYDSFDEYLTAKVQSAADMINEYMDEYDFDKADIIGLLDIYSLYDRGGSDPDDGDDDEDDNGGGGGGGGGGGSVPEDTDTTPPDVTKVVDELKDLVKVENGQQPVIENAVKALENANTAIEKITDPAKALEAAQSVIKATAAVISSAESSGISADEIGKQLAAVANTVLAKVNEVKAPAVITGTSAKAVIDNNTAANMVSKMASIAETAAKLNTELKNAGTDVKVEAVLRINAAVEGTYNEAAAELPASLLKAASEKNIDKIAIETGIATIAVAPDSIAADGAKTVAFDTKKVDAGELSADIKAAVGNNPVYDFNAAVDGSKVSNFNKPVDISVPYTLKAGEDAEKITVFYINDKGELENVIGIYDAETGTVKFSTNHFSQYVVKPNDVAFTDLDSAAWAKKAVGVVASKGIIGGVGDNKFAPNANVTRAQFITMIVNAFKLVDTSAECNFSDVPKDSGFYKFIASGVKNGLIGGRPDGAFGINDSITRQDMAVILANVLKVVKAKDTAVKPDSYLKSFKDSSDIAGYAKAAVAVTVKNSVMGGMTVDTYGPKSNVTRAQAAAVIYKMLYIK